MGAGAVLAQAAVLAVCFASERAGKLQRCDEPSRCFHINLYWVCVWQRALSVAHIGWEGRADRMRQAGPPNCATANPGRPSPNEQLAVNPTSLTCLLGKHRLLYGLRTQRGATGRCLGFFAFESLALRLPCTLHAQHVHQYFHRILYAYVAGF